MVDDDVGLKPSYVCVTSSLGVVTEFMVDVVVGLKPSYV
jgi:hypothetical protein